MNETPDKSEENNEQEDISGNAVTFIIIICRFWKDRIVFHHITHFFVPTYIETNTFFGFWRVRESSRLTPGKFRAPSHPEAALVYLFGEYTVGIIIEPQEHFAPQQPREVEKIVLEGLSNEINCS